MKINPTPLLSSLIISAGLSVLAWGIFQGVVSFKDRDRVVIVKGLSEREVKADKVTWSLQYKELGNDPSVMYSLLEQKNRIVVNFLKAEGITDAEISLNPPTISDRQADNYGNEIMNYRYKATCIITVTSSDVEKVRRLMRRQAELMKQGVAIVCEEYGGNTAVSYEFTRLNDIKPTMVEEATKNARLTAEKFAEDSGSKLGGIRSATQGQFSIENRDNNTPYIKRIRVVNTIEYMLD